MAQLTTFHLAHLPPDLAVNIALFRDLKNQSFLKQQLLDGNEAFEYAFLDAQSVCLHGIPLSRLINDPQILSTTHILAAVFRAATDMANKRMKSRNVHSEIVFALSPNNNVGFHDPRCQSQLMTEPRL